MARQATFARKLRTEEAGMGSYLVRAPIPVIDLIAAHRGRLQRRDRRGLPRPDRR